MGVTSKDGSDGSEGSEGKEGGSDRMPLNDFEKPFIQNEKGVQMPDMALSGRNVYSPLEVFNF